MFYTSLGNSVGSLTDTGPFGSTLQPEAYWSGTECDTDLAWAFDFAIGYQYDISRLDLPLVWAVRDVTAIPEPVSLLLLGVDGGNGVETEIKEMIILHIRTRQSGLNHGPSLILLPPKRHQPPAK